MCFPRLPGFSHPLLEVESEAWLDIWLITCLTSAKSGGCSSVELVESCTLVGSLKLQPCNSARILSTRGTTSSVLHCFFFFVLNLMYSYFGVGYVRVLRTRDKAERARLKFAIDRCSCCSSFLDIFDSHVLLCNQIGGLVISLPPACSPPMTRGPQARAGDADRDIDRVRAAATGSGGRIGRG